MFPLRSSTRSMPGQQKGDCRATGSQSPSTNDGLVQVADGSVCFDTVHRVADVRSLYHEFDEQELHFFSQEMLGSNGDPRLLFAVVATTGIRGKKRTHLSYASRRLPRLRRRSSCRGTVVAGSRRRLTPDVPHCLDQLKMVLDKAFARYLAYSQHSITEPAVPYQE